MNTTKQWLVVLHTDDRGPVYLGTAGVGDVNGNGRNRQGVRFIQNATRFTSIGAKRVAKGYTDGRGNQTASVVEIA